MSFYPGKISSFRSPTTTPKDVSARIQLKTIVELSLAHLVSKCFKENSFREVEDHTLDLNVS
jgi:hypothetical protein